MYVEAAVLLAGRYTDGIDKSEVVPSFAAMKFRRIKQRVISSGVTTRSVVPE
jgi:hypothetical protein